VVCNIVTEAGIGDSERTAVGDAAATAAESGQVRIAIESGIGDRQGSAIGDAAAVVC
jgi:hypothetical protein